MVVLFKYGEDMTKITLKRASLSDASEIYQMQLYAFIPLLLKYDDYNTSPAAEPIERTIFRLKQKSTYYYFICLGNDKVGAIRVVDDKRADRNKRISPLFVISKFQGCGIAQEAILAAERIHGKEHWELATILQEPRNCHLYEKMGYRRSGRIEPVNDKMSLVFYEK